MKYIIGNIYSEYMTCRQGTELAFDGKNIRIILLRKNLSEEFIKQIRENELFFQLFLREGIIFLLIKFEQLNWLDIPFIAQCKKDALVHLPSDNHGYGVKILLFDAMSGKLHVNRVEAFSHGLSKALYWAAAEQIKNPPQNVERKINKVRASFDAQEMARLSLGKK